MKQTYIKPAITLINIHTSLCSASIMVDDNPPSPEESSEINCESNKFERTIFLDDQVW